MSKAPSSLREIIAAAIANARGGRRGMPPVVNILEILPVKLRDEVLDDADHVLTAIWPHLTPAPAPQANVGIMRVSGIEMEDHADLRSDALKPVKP